MNKRKILIENGLKISITKQCELPNIGRATHYYKPVPMSEDNLNILHMIDEIATDNSEYGYKFIHRGLLEHGYSIGKDRVLKYIANS